MLPVGTTAPDFTLRDQNQQPVTLSGYRGAKNVLLVFFPLAFTGICQGELDRLRDHLPDFENDESVALAISVGPPPTHKIWSIESGFTFPVLSDFWPHGEVSQAYGVFNDAGRLLQSRHLRRRPRGDHSIRGDERTWRSARSAFVDRRPGGLYGPEGFGSWPLGV